MNKPTSDLKEKGKAGLLFAYDENMHYTAANQAINGRLYTCPICGCPMHVTTTRNGKRIFARNPHHSHTNSICITIERNGGQRSFNNLDPDTFIQSLCKQNSCKKELNPKHPTFEEVAYKETEIKKVPTLDTESNLASFSSLKQIAESGIEYLNPNDIQGTHKVYDFIITYKYASNFFTNPNFHLGARIVYVRFSWPDSKNKSLIFSMFIRNNFSVKFCLRFSYWKDFNNYRDKFGRYIVNEAGKSIFQKNYKEQNVLIACDKWQRIDKSNCNTICSSNASYCKSCYAMYQATYTNSKQIYLLPIDH